MLLSRCLLKLFFCVKCLRDYPALCSIVSSCSVSFRLSLPISFQPIHFPFSSWHLIRVLVLSLFTHRSLKLYHMYVCVLSAYLGNTCMQKPEAGVGSPETWGTGGCEQPDVRTEPRSPIRTANALNLWAISPDSLSSFLFNLFSLSCSEQTNLIDLLP